MPTSARITDDAPPFNPAIALFFAVFAVSTGAIFARLADAPALVTAAYRLGLSTLMIAPFAWWKSKGELLGLSRSDLRLAIIAGFFLALHFATWISSLDYTSVANSVVLVNTNPLWVGLLTPWITKEHLKKTTVIGILFSVLGGAIIGMGDFAAGGKALLGDGLALCGSICMAVYLLIGRNLRRKLSLLPYVFVCYGSAAVILWITVIALRLPVSGFNATTITAFFGMAVVSQVIGHSSYNWALKWFSPSLIAVCLLGEPVGSTIMAYFFFHEGLSAFKIIGGIIILFAIYMAAAGERGGKK
jgi:drug/metabolite transporter (DMT)-like permease